MMADFDSQAMQAFVLAADSAQQHGTDTACKQCGSASGQPYLIHFAKRTEQSQLGDTIITSYANIGARKVPICTACLTQYQQAKRKEWLLKLIVILIPAIIGIVGLVLLAEWREFIAAVEVLAGLLLLPCIYNLNLYKSPQKAGRKLAMALSQADLEREGYDSFWDHLNIDDMRQELAAEG